MTNYERLQDEVAYGFKKLYGRCGVYINRPISPIGCIIKLLKLFLEANANRTICIVVDNIYLHSDIKQACYATINHKIDVLTKNYSSVILASNFDLIITVNIDDLDFIKKITTSPNYKFYLSIFDNCNVKDKKYIERGALMPFITISTPADKIIEDTIHLPVNETQIGVDLTGDAFEDYKKANEYVSTSIKIFGNFETLDRCRIGDKVMNHSPIYVCEIVASNNGWRYDIDTSTDFGKELDDTYNPNALNARAMHTYNMIRLRKNIVSNAKEKISVILDIVHNNIDKNILIVSASGEFASKITDEINHFIKIEEAYDIICGNYHNELPDTVQKDKYGNPVLIKSGQHKGEQKIIGSQKQSTLAEKAYNDGDINVLSIKGSSDPKLRIDVDIVIITSPNVGTIYDIRRRFQNVYFRTNPLEIYTIYCNGTIENTKLCKFNAPASHRIINDDENIFVTD